MSNQIKKVIGIDLDIDSLKQSAETARKLMENLETSGKPPQKLVSSFEKIDKVLTKIQTRTKNGVFKGSDSEYNALANELNSIGEEFEYIKNTLNGISKMDDDALSKFLTREDLQIFRQATKVLKDYQSILSKIEQNGSTVLQTARNKHKNVSGKLETAKEKQKYRGSVVAEREQKLTEEGYFAGRAKVEETKAVKTTKKSELSAAQKQETEKRGQVGVIEGELKVLDAQIAAKKAELEEELKELNNAKAAFARMQKKYNEPDENGQVREKDEAYYKAEERVKTAEGKIKPLTELKTQRASKLEEKAKATGELATASQEVQKLTVELNEATEAYDTALAAQTELETKLEDTIKGWEEAKEIYKAVTAEVEKYTIAEEDAKRVLDNAEANEEINKKTELADAYKVLCAEAQKLGIELSDLGITEEYSEDSEQKLIAAIQDHKKVLVDRIRVVESTDKAFDKMDDALDDNRKKVDANREAQAELNEQLRQQEAFEARIKQFLGMAGAVQVLKQAFQSAFETTKELDSVMTEMAVVTDLEIGDYWDQLPEHTERAKELGISIKSVYEAETLYYQQGLKTEEVIALSNQTLKMARIAGLSAADATDKMTAALRGFNMELNETSAQNVADVYSELAAITAADVNDISSAMSKTASIASSAGMEFETTAAFLSQIIETTQESAETAGTAMKTVIARFQELKKDPSEIGEVDGEIVDANAIEKALRSVGVSLRDASGQFRDLDDVFLELSSKWNSLDKNTQRYIATIAAGSRQQSRFLAMMSDYGRTQELVTAANNSSGASNEQFEKTMDSLSAKLEQLKAAWDEFTTGILESDLVKFGVEVLTKFLEIINKATKTLKGFGGAIMKVITTIALFKLGQKIFDKIKKPFLNFLSSLTTPAYEKGIKIGEAYAKGFKVGTERVLVEGEIETPQEEETTSTKKTFKENVADKTGVTGIKTGVASLKDSKAKKAELNEISGGASKAELEAKVKETEALKNQAETDLDGTSEANAAFESAQNQYDEATKTLDAYNKKAAEVQKASAAGWQSVGKGIQSAGTAVTALGVGVSMVGGILSSLGLEEAGEVISGIGTAITFVGSAITIIGTLIPAVAAIAEAAGMSVAAAWGWVALIVAGIMLLIGAVILIYKHVQNNTPEKKLERVQKAADAAAEGAERAAEAYENLSDSLDSLDDKYKALDGLIRGTKEWNKAVQETNASVLDLINQYPELAGFVENDAGVLTLDVDSEGVQNVLKSYQADSAKAQGAAIGAKIDLAQANADFDLDKMDDKIFEKFQTDGQAAATWTAIGNLAAATTVGAAGGAAIGAGTGAAIVGAGGTVVFPGLGTAAGVAAGAGMGALWGAIAGGITGLVGGIATFQSTVDSVEKSNEQNRKNVETLAQAYANGETGETVEEIAAYVERTGIASGKAAEQMAQALMDESETLLEFGNTLNAVDAQEKAYYQAMATNAQQLLDLGQFSEQALNQINTIVDEDLMKVYEEAEKERLLKESKEDENEFEKSKEAFARATYGSNAKVVGNKIIDEKGETVREFSDDKEWINQIAAAEATTKAAEAMKEIPGALKQAFKDLEPDLQRLFSKAFEGGELTEGQFTTFKKQLGTATYYDENGTVAASWDSLSDTQKQAWSNDEKAYLNSLDVDYSGIDTMWENLSNKQKMAYGWDGDLGNTEGLDKAKEAFEATFTEIVDNTTEALGKAQDIAKKLDVEISPQMTAQAAQAWMTGLEQADLGASDGEIKAVNDALTGLLSGLTEEQAALVMAEINAMDKMDLESWNGLAEVFDGLDVDYNTEQMTKFIETGKQAYNAIEKIDFGNLANDINETYKLINKVKQGGRTYSEGDYKELIAANKELSKNFTKIGNEYIYVGSSMDSLVEALEENTLAKLGEANRQLNEKSGMANIIKTKAEDYGQVESMDSSELITYITDMRLAIADKGHNIADLGIAGLSNSTELSKATTEQLREWAQQVAAEGGKAELYEKSYKEGLKQANIQRYTHNDASYNAQMAVDGGEYAEQHQEALILQAIQSGAVSNATIEAYRKAIEDKDYDLAKELGKDIANATDKIVQASEGRNAYSDLIKQVENALIAAQQKEINALTDINDSINDANDKLINSIQEQIAANRAKEQLKEQEEELSSFYSQQAYLNADSSGANALASKQLDQDIQEAEKSLEETYIDQAIQALQDANEQAAEQRERQISIMEAQLEQSIEQGDFYQRASEIVQESMEQLQTGTTLDETKMYDILFSDSGENLSGLAAEDWASDLWQMATKAQNWYDEQQNGSETENVTGDQGSTNSTSGSSSVSTTATSKDQAVAKAVAAVQGSGSGYAGVTNKGSDGKERNYLYNWLESDNYKKAWEAYKAADPNATEDEFREKVKDKVGTVTTGIVDGSVIGHNRVVNGDFDENIKLTIDGKTVEGLAFWDPSSDKKWDNDAEWRNKTEQRRMALANSSVSNALNQAYVDASGGFGIVPDLTLGLYNGTPYIYRSERWRMLFKGKEASTDAATLMKKHLNAFETGGLADFTGPAWLDGSKSRPEMVLNARDTQNFIQLKDILSEILDDNKHTSNHSSSSQSAISTIDIDINVEKIDSDYDVEQLANKIRSMLYNDATFRNVNDVSMRR